MSALPRRQFCADPGRADMIVRPCTDDCLVQTGNDEPLPRVKMLIALALRPGMAHMPATHRPAQTGLGAEIAPPETNRCDTSLLPANDGKQGTPPRDIRAAAIAQRA